MRRSVVPGVTPTDQLAAAPEPIGSPGAAPEPGVASGAEWQGALAARPEELDALWCATISRCRRERGEMVRDGGLDVLVQDDPECQVNRHRRLVDILEEHLLHTGQTPIVREVIDALVGEDPP